MNPGATTRPSASMTRFAPSFAVPTMAILSPEMATSATRALAPVPSTTLPLRMRRS